MNKNTEQEAILQAKNIAPTAMRLRVLEYFLEHKNAVSLAEIDNDFEKADRITLYRTLKTFEKKGLIHSIKEDFTTRYAICEKDCKEDFHTDSHLHFHCIKCEKTFCMPKVKIPVLNLPDKFFMEEVSLSVKGICDKCSIQTLQ